jgi:hypothetical protein
MTPDEIINIVKKVAAPDVDMTVQDMEMLERYFIREYCKWIPLSSIAKLTGVKCHTTVQASIKAVISHSKYILPRQLIKQRIEDRISTQLRNAKI